MNFSDESTTGPCYLATIAFEQRGAFCKDTVERSWFDGFRSNSRVAHGFPISSRDLPFAQKNQKIIADKLDVKYVPRWSHQRVLQLYSMVFVIS